MSFSLFNVQTQQNPRGVNVLTEDADPGNALQKAIAAVGGTFSNVSEVGLKPIDVVVQMATSPATDGAPKAVFRADFRPGSGQNGSTPNSVTVLSWPQTNAGVVTVAAVLAARAAATFTGGVVSQVTQLSQVEIDATGGSSTIAAPVSKYQFRTLFTLSELVAVDNVETSSLTPDQKALVNTIRANFDAAQDILLTDPGTVQGVDYLASVGLITSSRAADILAGHPAPTA